MTDKADSPATTPQPIGPHTVTVLGSIWRPSAPWAGLDFSRAKLRDTSIWGDDYHLNVPWCHPSDQDETWGTPAYEPDCWYRVRPRRKSWRFVQVDGVWMVAEREPANAK
jgi:hypothetical protein